MTALSDRAAYRIPASYRRTSQAVTWLGLAATIALVVALDVVGQDLAAAVLSPLVAMALGGVWLAVRLPAELGADGEALTVVSARGPRGFALGQVRSLGREPLSGLVYLRLEGARTVWIPTGPGWPEFVMALGLPPERCAPAAMRRSVWRDGLALR